MPGGSIRLRICLTLSPSHQLEISKEAAGSDDDQGKAYAALAAAYQKLGDAVKAVECLEKFLRIAQVRDNPLLCG